MNKLASTIQHALSYNVLNQKHALRTPLTHATKQLVTATTARLHHLMAVSPTAHVVCALPANQTGSEKEALPSVNHVQIQRPTEVYSVLDSSL